jgi:hypothetical protein
MSDATKPSVKKTHSTRPTVAEASQLDAHGDNPLIEACGPILQKRDIVRRLLYVPPVPAGKSITVEQARAYDIPQLWRLHIPSAQGLEVVETIDMLLRQGYVQRKPGEAATRRMLCGFPPLNCESSPLILMSAVSGVAGCGKTQALDRALRLWPRTVVHEKLPGFEGAVKQLIWLKVDVPGSGKLADLIEALFRAMDEALGTDYLSTVVSDQGGLKKLAASTWLAKARLHFLGILVLDEVQNFFRIQSKKVRQSERARGGLRADLRVVEDESLKFVLNLANTSLIPLLVAGTPDGLQVLSTRMSTGSRVSIGGLIRMPHAQTADDRFFCLLLDKLQGYQWTRESFEVTDLVRAEIFRWTGGILRNVIGLWVHAQRRALNEGSACMDLTHLQWAAEGPQELNQNAVAAMLSQNPRRMADFEDLAPTWAD